MSRLTLTRPVKAELVFNIGSGWKKRWRTGERWKYMERWRKLQVYFLRLFFTSTVPWQGAFMGSSLRTHPNLGMIVQKSQWNPDHGWFEWMSVPKWMDGFFPCLSFVLWLWGWYSNFQTETQVETERASERFGGRRHGLGVHPFLRWFTPCFFGCFENQARVETQISVGQLRESLQEKWWAKKLGGKNATPSASGKVAGTTSSSARNGVPASKLEAAMWSIGLKWYLRFAQICRCTFSFF